MVADYKDFWALVFKRHQIFLFFSLVIVVLLLWAYLAHLNSLMSSNSMNLMSKEIYMPKLGEWTLNDFFSALLMWSVMMVAMMLPSASPMILIFSAVNKKRFGEGKEFVPTWAFVVGYILIWIFFSVFASLLQWLLHTFAILSPELRIMSPLISGIVLISAGIYQFTSVKNVCLRNCQSPLGFIMEHWRDGKKGAFVMGLRHGFYCVGCCWVLMGLLLVAGVMNLLWIALITTFILAEKLLRYRWITTTSGTFLIIFGISIFGFSII